MTFRSQQKRKPLPKLVLRLMKEQEIRKKLREFGLQAQGDRKTLESRYQRYLTLYNAECDKLDPRPVADVLRQCIEEERVDKNDSASQDPNVTISQNLYNYLYVLFLYD